MLHLAHAPAQRAIKQNVTVEHRDARARSELANHHRVRLDGSTHLQSIADDLQARCARRQVGDPSGHSRQSVSSSGCCIDRRSWVSRRATWQLIGAEVEAAHAAYEDAVSDGDEIKREAVGMLRIDPADGRGGFLHHRHHRG